MTNFANVPRLNLSVFYFVFFRTAIRFRKIKFIRACRIIRLKNYLVLRILFFIYLTRCALLSFNKYWLYNGPKNFPQAYWNHFFSQFSLSHLSISNHVHLFIERSMLSQSEKFEFSNYYCDLRTRPKILSLFRNICI